MREYLERGNSKCCVPFQRHNALPLAIVLDNSYKTDRSSAQVWSFLLSADRSCRLSV